MRANVVMNGADPCAIRVNAGCVMRVSRRKKDLSLFGGASVMVGDRQPALEHLPSFSNKLEHCGQCEVAKSRQS